jgi:hypothetical protein
MNDTQIRESFHRTKLRRHHASRNTLVVDELGLHHGRCRADIAVVSNRLIGYEIKSDDDSLRRLDEQIGVYGKVFDQATVIVGPKHVSAVYSLVPDWWGIILSSRGPGGEMCFDTVRPPRTNKGIDPLSVAQLLWSKEAARLLMDLGEPERISRERRAVLYERLASLLSPVDLRSEVRKCLKRRRNWRCPESPSASDGSSQPIAK